MLFVTTVEIECRYFAVFQTIPVINKSSLIKIGVTLNLTSLFISQVFYIYFGFIDAYDCGLMYSC